MVKQENTDTVNQQQQQQMQSSTALISTSKPSLMDYMGSMTSVNTVREVNPGDSNTRETSVQPMEEPSSTTLPLDSIHAGQSMDINQIYDDVMQCVYDDVDTKYDDVVLAAATPDFVPVPPTRKRGLSMDKIAMGAATPAGIEDDGLDKPLPTTPNKPSIISKLSEKKNELMKEREKEAERRRLIEEQKRRE